MDCSLPQELEVPHWFLGAVGTMQLDVIGLGVETMAKMRCFRTRNATHVKVPHWRAHCTKMDDHLSSTCCYIYIYTNMICIY